MNMVKDVDPYAAEEIEQKKLFKIARTYENYKKYLYDYEGTLGGPEPIVFQVGLLSMVHQ